MKTVILGAGFSGLTAAYRLAKAGRKVIVVEKNKAPGGVAGGFKKPGWGWYLDNTYHHCFTNEKEILQLAKEIGFPPFLVLSPETASLYSEKEFDSTNQDQLFNYLFGKNNREYKLDSALDLLKFGRLPFLDRLRTGVVLAVLKFGPMFKLYHEVLAKDFLTQTMGEKANKELWEPLFLKKFSRYYKEINMGFFWARLRRTPKLSYPPGGYQALADCLARAVSRAGGKILLNTKVQAISANNNGFCIKAGKETFKASKLISTLPSPVFLQLEKGVLPQKYRDSLRKIKYLGAKNIIISSKQKVLPQTYWLSLAAKNEPRKKYPGLDYMVLVQQTNFVSAKNYGNTHPLYLATYTNRPKTFVINNKKLAKSYKVIKQSFVPYGQPLYTPEFVRNKPDYIGPVKNLYFANMELTYPYDRGTNQAVRCGNKVAKYSIPELEQKN